ncbi:hypothetical protein ACJ41O_008759 [Fusarium nematophilum]
MSTTPSMPVPTTPTRPISTLPVVKTPVATCSSIDAIVARIEAHHDQKIFIEEGQWEDGTQAIIDSLTAQEQRQDIEVQQLDFQYQHWKEQRAVIEKAIDVLRDNLSFIECEIETTIRSQEQAKSKAQKHRMQRASKLQDRRRDMMNETLYRDVSRYGRLITDIIQIVHDSSYGTEV